MKRESAKAWYFQGSFFIQILWAVFSFSFIVISILYATRTSDPFFSSVIGKKAVVLLSFTIIIFFIIVSLTVVVYLSLFSEYRKYILISICATTVLLFILTLIFVLVCGTASYRDNTAKITIENYVFANLDTRNTEMDWFNSHVTKTRKNPDKRVIRDKIYTYTDMRTEDAGSALIGCFCAWLLFDALLLYHIYKEDISYQTLKDSKQPMKYTEQVDGQ